MVESVWCCIKMAPHIDEYYSLVSGSCLQNQIQIKLFPYLEINKSLVFCLISQLLFLSFCFVCFCFFFCFHFRNVSPKCFSKMFFEMFFVSFLFPSRFGNQLILAELIHLHKQPRINTVLALIPAI